MNVEHSKRPGIPHASGSVPLRPTEPRAWPPLALIFVLVALGIFAGGIFSYRNYARRFRTGIEQQLSAITELKVEQIAQWRRERLGNAAYVRSTPYAARRALNALAEPASPGNRQNFTSWLEALFASAPYEQALVLDESLNVGLVYPEHTSGVLSEATRQAAQEALSSRHVVMTDLHRETEGGPVYLSLLVPLVVRRESTGDNVPAAGTGSAPTDRSAGILVLQINAQKDLYPLIQRWPTPSRTAESLLVRREGNDALFLSELKFLTNTALRLRVSLASTNVPAVKAALGQEGIVEGIDYRGQPVVASLRAIPDSPWSLVTRMDTTEVYAPLHERLWLTLLLMGALLLGAGASVGLIWRQQGVQFYRERHEAAETLRASEIRYRTLVEYSPDLIGVLMEGRLAYINAAGLKLFGADRPEQMLGKSMAEFVHPDDLPVVRQRLQRLMEMGQANPRIELRFLRLDGTTVLIEGLSAPVVYEGKPAGQIICRDITERKRAEAALRESEERFRKVFEEGGLGMAMADLAGGPFIRVNGAFCEMLGYTEEALQRLTFADITHPDDRARDVEAVKSLREGQIQKHTTEKRYLRQNGEVVWGRGL